MRIPKSDMDYVILYAEKLKMDNSLFSQQKILIESQIKSSREMFNKRFKKGENFKKNARSYLKKMSII